MTINNLQEALMEVKHKLDELQQKASLEVSGWSRWFGFSDPSRSVNNSNDNNNTDTNVHDI